MFRIVCFVVLFLLFYYVIRFHAMKGALREMERQLGEIKKDLTQNQVLHLPAPDRDMESLMYSVNCTLDEIRAERKQYARRERELQSQIEAISHDLRTPLTVILGYLKMLQNQEGMVSEAKEQKEILDIAVRKGYSMKKLIDQFYEYSRLQANDYHLELERIDAGKILREVFVDNCLILEDAHLQVVTELADHPVWAKGEKDSLERIIINLLQNAGRYGHQYFKLSVKETEKQVQIIFENDTKKIAEKDIDHLFDRFYKNDSARSQGGTGLGLTIAKELAEVMGGSLEVDIKKQDDQNPHCGDGDECRSGSDENCRMVRFVLCLERL